VPQIRPVVDIVQSKYLFTYLITYFQVDVGARQASKDSDVIRTRKGVVKMLIASVSVYVISYAPTQMRLFYNLISATPFRANWTFLVLLMTLSYVNSAANPVLYSVFSHNFRHLFRRLLCVACLRRRQDGALDAVTVVSERRPTTQRSTARSVETFRMTQHHGASPLLDDIVDDQIIVNSDRE